MSEEAAEQFIHQMQMLEAYIADLYKLQENLIAALRETAATIDSIDAIRQNPESDSLMPLGPGVFIPAKVLAGSKMVVDIGAGAAVEKDPASAINFLESRVKEVQTALNDSTAKREQALAQLNQGRAQLSQMMQAGQQHKTP